MFDSLQERLGEVLDKLTRRGSLSEADVTAALREVRVALLEADVALPVVKDFIEAVKDKAVGEQVLRSVAPGQMVIKIVHDHLIEMLGAEAVPLDFNVPPPAVILLVGLQGSGKTTSCAKIGLRLSDKAKKKVLMASLDVRRPAAQEQLKVLGLQTGVRCLDAVPGEPPVAIAKRALQTGALEGYDVVLLDTAGRLAVDEEMMADARGGAALSMRAVTGCPIKLIGVGEKLDALEDFHPDRIASRILGMGDVVSLVEKAAETIEQEEAEKLAKKIEKGRFDLDDLGQQLKQMQKMGGLSDMLKLLPGMSRAQQAQIKNANFDDGMVKRQLAILSSMTPRERRRPEIIKASRKQRVAAGSGTTVQEINKLLKQHKEASRMVKRVSKMSKKGLMRGGLSGLLPPSGGFAR